jgi:hypothetical protein
MFFGRVGHCSGEVFRYLRLWRRFHLPQNQKISHKKLAKLNLTDLECVQEERVDQNPRDEKRGSRHVWVIAVGLAAVVLDEGVNLELGLANKQKKKSE